MAFQTIPVNITGPSYKDRSKPLASQETRNFYHEVVDSGSDKYVIKSFPGQKNLGSTTAGSDRGLHQMNEVCYRVVDTSLFKVLSDGNHIFLGVIKGTERCIFADDGINLFIVSSGFVTKYNSTTNTVTAVTDPDIAGALSVTFINNQFVYTFPRLTVFSDVGDGSNATSLNAIGAENNPDNLVRDYAFDQILYRFGKRSVENWYNSGVGTPPFEIIQGQVINTGLNAIHSVANSSNFIYWLGSDCQVYQARSGQETPISTAAIAGIIQKYNYVEDAFGDVITIDDKSFYVLTFPTEDKTWCLNESLGVNGWFELSELITNGRWNVNSCVEVYGKVLVGDRSNGNLNELDFDTYTQAGSAWRRRRVLASINGSMFGQNGKRVQMSRMEFILETGTGLVTGQGDTPNIMLEVSYDGGRSWSTGSWLKIGRQGETNIRAEWFSMRSFYDMMVRLTTSDAVAFNVYSAAIDLRLAGR